MMQVGIRYDDLFPQGFTQGSKDPRMSGVSDFLGSLYLYRTEDWQNTLP